jgi:hypothetical protein
MAIPYVYGIGVVFGNIDLNWLAAYILVLLKDLSLFRSFKFEYFQYIGLFTFLKLDFGISSFPENVLDCSNEFYNKYTYMILLNYAFSYQITPAEDSMPNSIF